MEYDQLPSDLSKAKIQWQGNVGLLGTQRQGKNVRYNLVQKTNKGYRLYFGVTEDGIHGRWKALVGGDEVIRNLEWNSAANSIFHFLQ
jgi:hypothetical protein